MEIKRIIASLIGFGIPALLTAQMPAATLRCTVLSENGLPLPLATVFLPELHLGSAADSLGTVEFKNLPLGELEVEASYVGFFPQKKKVQIEHGDQVSLTFQLALLPMEEVVVTGAMREIRRSDSPIPVEVISSKHFLHNPSPNLFESASMLSGIQPVLNCNVCNTGDIQINGMEGVYTQVLLDGMPIVSGLGTVYGLMGIPNSMIDRIEVVKGPAGSLYGAEAMAGQINILTKSPEQAPQAAAEVFATSWQEWSADAGWKTQLGKNASALWGMNGFWFQHPADYNRDGFTDLAQQKRVSAFSKWGWKRRGNRAAHLGLRYVWEDRWGGEVEWTPHYRGSDVFYGESIFTARWEAFGKYQIPAPIPVFLQASYNSHRQNSYYGTTPYVARQEIAFLQAYMEKSLEKHLILAGAALRHTFYEDNTPATAAPSRALLPGLFIQNEWKASPHLELLTGIRLDWHPRHGAVWSPRLAIHQHLGPNQSLRWSAGSGFRVVSLFTEDHAALSGAREVVIQGKLNPERSWTSILNYTLKIPSKHFFLNLDATAFYTRFSNRILPDYDSDPQKIIYSNLDGSAHSRGITLQANYTDGTPLTINMGITFMDVFSLNENQEKTVQIRAPKWSGVLLASYTHPPSQITLDLSGNWYGPQRLPIVPNDFRPAYSPWFAILNFQVSKKFRSGFDLFGGVKNLLHFVPQYPILRPFDPFDRLVDDPLNNPFGYTFDPSYNYAPLQGIRGFLGMRFTLYEKKPSIKK